MKTLSFLSLASVVLLVAACSSGDSDESASTDSALTGDIDAMFVLPDGLYEVKCKDGRVEHDVSAERIAAGAVCTPASSSSSSSSSSGSSTSGSSCGGSTAYTCSIACSAGDTTIVHVRACSNDDAKANAKSYGCGGFPVLWVHFCFEGT